MAGRYQKPGATNRGAKFDWTVLPSEGRTGPAPKLPASAPGGRIWSAATRAWWKRLWAKPQATQWDLDDAQLFRYAGLHEKFWRDEASASELTEMRQIEDRHGLSNKAMLQLCWIVAPDEVGAARAARTEEAAVSARASRPRVVDSALARS